MEDFSPWYHHILRVDIGLATQMGRRAKNEDYVAARLGRPDASGKKIVAAVADGLGGYKGGREASRFNNPQLKSALRRNTKWPLSAVGASPRGRCV